MKKITLGGDVRRRLKKGKLVIRNGKLVEPRTRTKAAAYTQPNPHTGCHKDRNRNRSKNPRLFGDLLKYHEQWTGKKQ